MINSDFENIEYNNYVDDILNDNSHFIIYFINMLIIRVLHMLPI